MLKKLIDYTILPVEVETKNEIQGPFEIKQREMTDKSLEGFGIMNYRNNHFEGYLRQR